MTENEALKSALEKVKAQKVNFGFMERFDVDENWEVMKALEEIQQYRAIGTVEEIQQKLAELDRWHTSEVNQLAEEYKDKEYCWQECASTEHCKECSRLGNGDNDYFESIDDWAENLSIIDAGELFGKTEQVNDGWISVEQRLPEANQRVLVFDAIGGISIEYLEEDEEFVETVLAWQPLPQPYKPKGENNG